MLLGTFKKTDTNGFRGSIRTLTLTLDLAFEPNLEKRGDKAPDYRVTAGEFGNRRGVEEDERQRQRLPISDARRPCPSRSHRLRAGQDRHRARLQPGLGAPPQPGQVEQGVRRVLTVTPGRFRPPGTSDISFQTILSGEFL